MFTGIVEEKGTISRVVHSDQSIKMSIIANKILEDIHIGDSIAVNGICLTVTAFTRNEFHLDVMPETIKSTSLRDLKKGSKVNLERAMAANGRFGGHFVTGHIDGVGKVKGRRHVGNAVYFDIEAEPSILKYILLKGSVAVDGASLTVFGVNDSFFTLSLIPHTLSETVLYEKKLGHLVNIECDMLGKYIEHFLVMGTGNELKNSSSITMSMLQENGFV